MLKLLAFIILLATGMEGSGMIAAHHSVASASGVLYIMPDGSSYWDSGFVASAGCEYEIDAFWLRVPQGYEYPILADKVYTSGSATVFTINTGARRRDAITTQIGTSETHLFDLTGFVGVRSTVRVKHKVSGNVFSIGIDGGATASSTTGNTFSSGSALRICYRNPGSYGGEIMAADTVKIYGIRMYRNGALEKAFVPKKVAGRPCLYDEVGREAHYSLGATDGVFGIEKGA